MWNCWVDCMLCFLFFLFAKIVSFCYIERRCVESLAIFQNQSSHTCIIIDKEYIKCGAKTTIIQKGAPTVAVELLQLDPVATRIKIHSISLLQQQCFLMNIQIVLSVQHRLDFQDSHPQIQSMFDSRCL